MIVLGAMAEAWPDKGDDRACTGCHCSRWSDVYHHRYGGGKDRLFHCDHRVERAARGVELEDQGFRPLALGNPDPA